MSKVNFRVSKIHFLVSVCLFFLFGGCPVFAQQTLRGNVTATTPTMANATSVVMLAAKQERSFMTIQNDSSAAICCSLTGATLTGIAPSATNLCLVIAAGNSYVSPANFITTLPVTCYQSSGGSINTILALEG